jgi:hypothetical protein
LVLTLLSEKSVSEKVDLARVYLELWSRHMGEGVIEMRQEGEHAYASGYAGARGVRTWQERMKLLESLGVIKTKQIGGVRHKYVLLIHPTAVVEKLRQQGKVPQGWLDTYHDRQIETKELTFEVRRRTKAMPKVVQMVPPKVSAQKTAGSKG